MKLTAVQMDRAVGVMLGSAAGDALGAGYEFKPALPDDAPVGMVGGNSFGWEPGEWTDDTSMAIPIVRALAAGSTLDDEATLDALVAAWSAWSREAKDVGVQTSALLRGLPSLDAASARTAAAARFAANPFRSGGNGSLMRTGPVALSHLADGQEESLVRAARAVSDLTHVDPDARDACVLWSLAIRHAIRIGELDLLGQVDWLPAERRPRWKQLIAEAEAKQPRDFVKNGWVVQALQGAWSAIRHGDGLVDTLERAVRGGRDTDTVAAIAGSLAGALHGGSSVPARWRRILHGWPGLRARDLTELAVLAVTGVKTGSDEWPTTDRLDGYGPETLVAHPHDDGVILASLNALDHLPDDVGVVVSLCRIGRKQTDREHLEFWLVDQPGAGHNGNVDLVLRDAADTIAALRAEGKKVAVHCVEARSRTAAVAITYAVRHRGAGLTQAMRAVAGALPNYSPQPFLLEAVDRIGDGDEHESDGAPRSRPGDNPRKKLYAVHDAWIDGHYTKGPVGIWGAGGVSYYPPETDSYRRHGEMARDSVLTWKWSDWVEMRTEFGSTSGPSWRAVESAEPMETVLDNLRAEFFAEEHPVGTFTAPTDSEEMVGDDRGSEEVHVPAAAPPADRIVNAQSWWIASEIARRHPHLIIHEMHPGGGQSDVLGIMKPGGREPLVLLNRTGGISIAGGGDPSPSESGFHLPWNDVLAAGSPHTAVKAIEDASGLELVGKAPASTPRTLAYRVIATLLNVSLNDRHRWDARNEFIDSSSDDDVELHGYLDEFPETQSLIADTPRVGLWHEPESHFWAVLRDDEPVAIVSIEGMLYLRGKKPVDVVGEYTRHGRRIVPCTGALFGALLS